MPHLLELFSGTGSIGRVFTAAGWQVTSVDVVARFNPTICKSVLDLTTEDIPGDITMIWASPPCVHYSRARTTAKTPRDLEGSDELVGAAINIAHRLNVPLFMENPLGLLKDRQVVKVRGLTRQTVDYCQYNELNDHTHRARKRTNIWTTTTWSPQRDLCRQDCRHCVNGKHVDHAQRFGIRRHTLTELYAIPRALPEEILAWYNEESLNGPVLPVSYFPPGPEHGEEVA